MTDQMVLKAQQWVNATYGAVPGYNRCAEDGSTGWGTVYSLTRALQHELGITALSDNFGPTTLSVLTAYGSVGLTSGNLNMRIIAEAALYCKGYPGGDLNGWFGVGTVAGLTGLVMDMGLNPLISPTDVMPKVFKGLLTMDAYVLTSGGNPEIRACQQWLNGAYNSRGKYFIGPCDGHFSRNVQTALVLAIQYQLGMTDAQVTGSIGPGTKAGLQAQAYVSTTSGSATWVRLFQTAFACNNYASFWGDSGGTFSDALVTNLRRFQEFCKLPQTGAGDYQTWMSLLVSTGDTDRPGTACDCMYPLNSTTIVTVTNLGYQIVGRYLTGGTNKVLTNSEIALIFGAGMSFFPIYQDSGNAVTFFSYFQGYAAGQAACAAAASFGIPAGTVIYFAVDYDAIDSEITSYVLPHFQGITAAVLANANVYSVGVYGSRNVCIRLAKAGLTTRSFVSGMSVGFSGNLGFPLPENWAFDQIKNFTVSSGTGLLELDHDVASGFDLGLNSVTRPQDPNDGFFTYLIWLEARALQWRELGHLTWSQTELVAQYLRLREPINNKIKNLIVTDVNVSDMVFGAHDPEFSAFVNTYPGKPDAMPLRDPAYLWDTDTSHFGASFGAVLTNGYPVPLSMTGVADFGSWGGDLLSVLGQCYQEGIPESAAYAFAIDRIASTGTNTFFDRGDFFANVDAMVLCRRYMVDHGLLLSALFKSVYTNSSTAKARFQTFIDERFGGSAVTMQAAAESMFDVAIIGGTAANLVRDAFWLFEFGDATCPTPAMVSPVIRSEVARAFVARAVAFATT